MFSIFEVCRHRHSSMTRSELTRPLFMTKGLRFRVRKERIAPLPSSQAACASTRATHAAGTNIRFDPSEKGSGVRAWARTPAKLQKSSSKVQCSQRASGPRANLPASAYTFSHVGSHFAVANVPVRSSVLAPRRDTRFGKARVGVKKTSLFSLGPDPKPNGPSLTPSQSLN